MNWEHASFDDKDRISSIKAQLHHVLQSCSAFGRHYLPASEEDENAVISWVPEEKIMVGKWVESESGLVRPGLDISSKTLIFQRENAETSSLDIQGNSFAQLMMWLEGQAGESGLSVDKFSADLPYELPKYDTQKGSPFLLEDDEALEALLSLYHNAFLLCSNLRGKFSNVSEVRIWPHHFDLAISVKLKESGNADTSTYLGIGFSPGDDHYDEPYFYTNSWPFADDALLRDLSNGHWHIDDWVGGVLTLNELVEIKEGLQEEKVFGFYESSTSQLSSIILQ